MALQRYHNGESQFYVDHHKELYGSYDNVREGMPMFVLILTRKLCVLYDEMNLIVYCKGLMLMTIIMVIYV